MTYKSALLILSALGLAGCYAKGASLTAQPIPTEPPPEKTTPAQLSEPSESAPVGGARPGSANIERARQLDARFAQEQRDSSWALDTEQKAHKQMVDGGARTISQFVCRASVCVGTYAFESMDRFKQTWNPLCGKLDFQGECIFAPAGGDLDFKFHLIKTPGMGRLEPGSSGR